MADDRIELLPHIAEALGVGSPISEPDLATWLARESGLPEPTRPETQHLLARLVLGAQGLLEEPRPEYEDSVFFHLIVRYNTPSDPLALAICAGELADLHKTLKEVGALGEDAKVGYVLVVILETALTKPIAFLAKRLVAAGYLSIF